MQKAIEEAKKSIGFTSPNPAVGAVIVKNGKIIGIGRTKRPGKNHAEINAIEKSSASGFAGDGLAGADLYVTLEPCSHTGRTGPCADAIIKAGIKKVFIGMKDPNPLVNGRGMKKLKKYGVQVEILLPRSKKTNEIRLLNQPFIKSVTTGLPYVTLKAAVSLDGKIATKRKDSKWITGSDARRDARMERSLCDAVVVGAGTVFADNPELAPHKKYKNKKLLRVIIDGEMSCDPKKKVFRDKNVLVACADLAPAVRRSAYDKAGIHYRSFGKKTVDIKKLLAYLASKEIRSVFVEGGSGVHGAFHDAALKDSRIIDKVIFYIAPKIIGGTDSISAVGGTGVLHIKRAFALVHTCVEILAGDIKIFGFLNYY